MSGLGWVLQNIYTLISGECWSMGCFLLYTRCPDCYTVSHSVKALKGFMQWKWYNWSAHLNLVQLVDIVLTVCY